MLTKLVVDRMVDGKMLVNIMVVDKMAATEL
jgi:hypothetical protein